MDPMIGKAIVDTIRLVSENSSKGDRALLELHEKLVGVVNKMHDLVTTQLEKIEQLELYVEDLRAAKNDVVDRLDDLAYRLVKAEEELKQHKEN